MLRKIRNDPRFSDVPVFVMSASTPPDDIGACRLLGCRQYYKKPYHLHEYSSVVAGMLKRRAATVY